MSDVKLCTYWLQIRHRDKKKIIKKALKLQIFKVGKTSRVRADDDQDDWNTQIFLGWETNQESNYFHQKVSAQKAILNFGGENWKNC